jgi:hypothetical protein
MGRSRRAALVSQSGQAVRLSDQFDWRHFGHWRERDGMSFDAFTSPDGLHMNDWGYGCWAKLLCTAISDAATRAITSTHAASASVHINNKSATQ